MAVTLSRSLWMGDLPRRRMWNQRRAKGSKTFALPRNVVLKWKICVVASGYTDVCGDSALVLNLASLGLRDALG